MQHQTSQHNIVAAAAALSCIPATRPDDAPCHTPGCKGCFTWEDVCDNQTAGQAQPRSASGVAVRPALLKMQQTTNTTQHPLRLSCLSTQSGCVTSGQLSCLACASLISRKTGAVLSVDKAHSRTLMTRHLASSSAHDKSAPSGRKMTAGIGNHTHVPSWHAAIRLDQVTWLRQAMLA